MVTMEIIIEQTDRLCWRERERESYREREGGKRQRERRREGKLVGGKVAEMFVGISKACLRRLEQFKDHMSRMRRRLSPLKSV